MEPLNSAATPKIEMESLSQNSQAASQPSMEIQQIAINAFADQPSFFPDTPFDAFKDPLKTVIFYLDKHNKFLFPSSPQLKALACVSKTWNQYIKEEEATEHMRLQKQAKLFSISNKSASNKTVEEVIDFIIENQLEVADLRLFKDLTNEHLNKLFENCPSIKHLMIQSPAITHLPKQCAKLQTLKCTNCYGLTSLADMPELTYLNCGWCRQLDSVINMPSLTHLDCTWCEKLDFLDYDMPSLIALKCHSCKNLVDLPEMPELIDLNCEYCHNLISLPDMPSLTHLNCSSCIRLTKLPENLPKLICLNCSSAALTALPVMPKLTHLTCTHLDFKTLEEFVPPELLQQLTGLNCTNWYYLTSLPDMPKLINLICYNCHSLNSMSNMPSLKSLTCYGCPNFIIEASRLPQDCKVEK